MTIEVNTITAPMPGSIKSYVALVNDYYTIVVNESLSSEARMRAYAHEMAHITNGDFERASSADEIEVVAHQN